jgi:hypothetical protein
MVREVDLARLSPRVKRVQSDWQATVTLGCPRCMQISWHWPTWLIFIKTIVNAFTRVLFTWLIVAKALCTSFYKNLPLQLHVTWNVRNVYQDSGKYLPVLYGPDSNPKDTFSTSSCITIRMKKSNSKRICWHFHPYTLGWGSPLYPPSQCEVTNSTSWYQKDTGCDQCSDHCGQKTEIINKAYIIFNSKSTRINIEVSEFTLPASHEA